MWSDMETFLTVVTILFTSITVETCVVNDDICDCSNAGTKGLDCSDATSLIVINNPNLLRSNWKTGVNITNVNFSSNRLQQIPIQLLPGNLEVLNISNNKIKDFKLPRFTKLKVLDISHNLVPNFHSHAFACLFNLEELYLKGNLLSDLRNVIGALKTTTLLKVLDLSENNFQEVFVPVSLKSIQLLNFESNQISSVAITRCSYDLPNLKRLNFEKNKLQSFPQSIIDSLKNTEIMLMDNELLCHCVTSAPVHKFVKTGITCLRPSDGEEVNNVAFSGCRMEDGIAEATINSSELILRSKSWQECPKLYCENKNCIDKTEICWDLPEHVCDEVHNLLKVTEGGLDLSMARHFNLNGVYTYKEYHTCNEVRLYTVTGHIDLKVISEQTPSEKIQNCAVTSEQTNSEQKQNCTVSEQTNSEQKQNCTVTSEQTNSEQKQNCTVTSEQTNSEQKQNCKVPMTICKNDDEDIHISTWKLALTIIIPCTCLITIICLVVYKRKSNSFRETHIESTNPAIQNPSPQNESNSKSRPKSGVPHVVVDGYLTILNGNDAPNILVRVEETEAQEYERMAVDDYGYLLASSCTIAPTTTPSVGYYLLLREGSTNEVMVGEDGYLSVNQPVNVIEDEDGYVCMTLKRDQGDLGQLVTDPNLYIKLERETGEDVHIYEKLQTPWKLLRFWQGKEENTK